MSYTDRTLTCADCGTNFTFSADDQSYHAEKGFTNEPKRCPSCRAAKREQRGDGGGAYRSGGGQRELLAATCSACGKEARVPFQPNGSKPVYCSDCFRSQQGAASGRDRGGRREYSFGGFDRSGGRGSRW